MRDFNEWMAYIYRQLGYPEETIELYLSNKKQESNEDLSISLSDQKSSRNNQDIKGKLLCLREKRIA